MIQRRVLATRALLVAGFALIPLGCSDSSAPASAPASASQPSSAEPPKPLTAKEKKQLEREFENMGVKEKREWRKRQREAAGGAAAAGNAP